MNKEEIIEMYKKLHTSTKGTREMSANELADELTKMFRGFYEDRIEAGRRREETMMKIIESLLKKAQEK